MKKKKQALLTGLLVCALAFTLTCQLAVDEAVQDIALTDPYISIQPASYAYFAGEAEDAEWAIPELGIEVYEWAASEGSLTYQWYTFDTIDDYVLGKAERIPGATGLKYRPAALKTAAGDKNYFYVVVTNTNSAVNIGVQSGTVQSEVAIISFSANMSGNTGALAPIISRHPGNAGYQAGRAVNALTTRAAPRSDRVTAARNAQLTYQWFSLTVGEDEDGEPEITREAITGVLTTPSYQPDPLTLKAGANYFYVVVTSTETNANGNTTYGSVSETSVPAAIEILRGARAVAPSITVQPRDKMYFINEEIKELEVDGVSRDNGAISFQWYRTTAPGTAGTIIDNATASKYKPDIGSPDADGKATTAAVPQYYYAVVTNFTEYVLEGGSETATETSKLAKVSVEAPGVSPAYNATVAVADPKVATNRYQYIRGYGGMDVAWANFPRTYPQEMETMYNPDTGLGYNINRIMISPGKVDPIEGINDLLGAHRPDYYENVKIVNKYGGYNLASPWSPPREWKSNNSINGGGHLLYQYRRQFANYLKTFAQNMYNEGAPIYAISISNEPNYTAGYDGCEWTPAEMRDFFKEVGRFTTGVRGYGGGRQTPVVLTVNGESANTPEINLAALRDPVSRSAIDLLCRHVYGVQETTLWRFTQTGSFGWTAANDNSTVDNILSRPDGTKMEVWMTEHNINSASAQGYVVDSTWNYVWRFMNDVDLVMRLNNENAFVWWASKRFYSMIGDGQYGTAEQKETNEPAVTPRGWGLSHYAKYTIDTHRIAAAITGTLANGTTAITNENAGTNVNNRTFSLDNPSARITAYASITSGKNNAPINNNADDVEYISLVMWTPTATGGTGGVDMGTIKITMPTINGQQFKIGSYTAIRSTGQLSTHLPYTVTVSADRTEAYVTLNPSQMLSVKFIRE
jgi:O-glycosyl hydrolase